jgi:hypothetical protein
MVGLLINLKDLEGNGNGLIEGLFRHGGTEKNHGRPPSLVRIVRIVSFPVEIRIEDFLCVCRRCYQYSIQFSRMGSVRYGLQKGRRNETLHVLRFPFLENNSIMRMRDV